MPISPSTITCPIFVLGLRVPAPNKSHGSRVACLGCTGRQGADSVVQRGLHQARVQRSIADGDRGQEQAAEAEAAGQASKVVRSRDGQGQDTRP